MPVTDVSLTRAFDELRTKTAHIEPEAINGRPLYPFTSTPRSTCVLAGIFVEGNNRPDEVVVPDIDNVFKDTDYYTSI